MKPGGRALPRQLLCPLRLHFTKCRDCISESVWETRHSLDPGKPSCDLVHFREGTGRGLRCCYLIVASNQLREVERRLNRLAQKAERKWLKC